MKSQYTPERLVRSHIKPGAAYTPGISPELDPTVARLDWNESPFGLSPKAQAAYDGFKTGNRYPDFAQGPLIQALANYIGTTPDRIIAGAGLDDVFTTLAIATIDPGDEVIISDPTFGVYRSLFTLHGAQIVNVPLGPAPDFSLNINGIIEAITDRTKIIIVCNPNNPTGTLFSKQDITRLIEAAPCLVAIDEAYAEFSGVNHLDLADQYDNVALFRTLSKFAGLAGYRCGYGVFPASLMTWLRTAAPPFFNLSAIAGAVAIASLADLDVLKGNVAYLNAERDLLIKNLNEIPSVTAYTSAANFILISLQGKSSAPIVEQLANNGVFVRRFASESYGLTDCLRVSLGLKEQNQRFLDQFTSALSSAN